VQLIKQNSADIKALTLFSDHGEEVYDKINIKGHSPDNVTANMLEVPLITWTSQGFIKHKSEMLSAMQQNQQQAFRLDNLFHYATNLMGIQSPQVNRNSSLAAHEFVPSTERKVYKKSYENQLRYRTLDKAKTESEQLVGKD
jgi:heptose-I-phosphate ethanolaminephosphotransferase